ncbi:MAG: retropepsin-like aspartic protease family protein [Hyphococcus sp.]
MRTEHFAAAAFLAFIVLGVRYIDSVSAPAGAPQGGAEMALANAKGAPPAYAAPARAHWSREVRIPAGHDHQFYINVEINRRSANFLIDTGASYVALRESDARQSGVYTAWTDFNYPVRTANGETNAALVTLDEMQIDGIRVEGVKAFILPDDQLSINLLGMSFLSRLDSVEARSGEMVLRG